MRTKVIVIVAILIGLMIMSGCTETKEKEPVDFEVMYNDSREIIAERDLAITNANLKIIELQENDKYLRKQKEDAIENGINLQETYNKIFLDWQYCYFADMCLYYEYDCVDYFKDILNGWTAREIHLFYSDECEGSDRDWERYISTYTGEFID